MAQILTIAKTQPEEESAGSCSDKPLLLNLGCGNNPLSDCVNVDINPIFCPNLVWDLNNRPWPWATGSVDGILAEHVFEHFEDWWACFLECVRILKPDGVLEIAVPDFTDPWTMTEKGHLHIFSLNSFKGIKEGLKNGWRQGREHLPWEPHDVPMKLTEYLRVVDGRRWIKWYIPKRLVRWCMDHLLGIVIEQRFKFVRLLD